MEYLKVIEDFILNSYPEQQTLFPIIRNILIVSFKISETFSDFQEQNTKGLIFQNLHDKTVDFFANKLEKQNENKIERLKKAQQDIDTDIQKEIVRDFESSLYYMMMDDFVLKNDLRSAIAESFKNIQTKLVINSYLSMFESKTLKGKRKEFFELKGKLIQAPEVMKDIIHSIQNLFPKEISEEIRDFLLFLETKTYSNIVKALAKGDFDSAKKRL